MKELHLTRADFVVEWFSGRGGGGQHRNKHANCCRIRHPATGLKAQSTAHRDRRSNQRDAFRVLARRILAHYRVQEAQQQGAARSTEVVRTYHAVRNEVIDKASGRRDSFKRVVLDAAPDEVIEARRLACALAEDPAQARLRSPSGPPA